MRPKNPRKSTHARRIHPDAIKTHNISDNTDQLQCHVTTSSWIKIFIHTGLRTGLYSRDMIHKLLYNLLHFSSQQRNKFLYFCSTIVNIVFSFINISILYIYMYIYIYIYMRQVSRLKLYLQRQK